MNNFENRFEEINERINKDRKQIKLFEKIFKFVFVLFVATIFISGVVYKLNPEIFHNLEKVELKYKATEQKNTLLVNLGENQTTYYNQEELSLFLEKFNITEEDIVSISSMSDVHGGNRYITSNSELIVLLNKNNKTIEILK